MNVTLKLQPVLDDFDPRVAINVTYPSKDKNVDLGNKLKPKWVHSSPDLFVEILPTKTIDFKATYVFAMTDPDATSRSHPIKGQFCHWLVGNITFEESSSPSALASSPSLKLNIPFNSEDAEVSELVSYYSPAPPPKTGFHRYIFTLLVMTNKTQEPLKKPKERIHWGYGEIGAGVREWATENELEVIGKALPSLNPTDEIRLLTILLLRRKLFLCSK